VVAPFTARSAASSRPAWPTRRSNRRSLEEQRLPRRGWVATVVVMEVMGPVGLRIRLQMIRTFACGGAETTFSHHLILNTIIRQAREFHRNALFFAGRSPRARRLRVSRRGRQRRGLRGRRIRCGRRRLTGSSALHLQLLASSDCRRLTRSLEYNFGLSNSSFNPKLGHCSRLDMMSEGGRSLGGRAGCSVLSEHQHLVVHCTVLVPAPGNIY